MDSTATTRPRRAIAAAVTIVVAIACVRVLVAGRTFGDEGYLLEEVPALAHIGERARAGDLPEWWDRVGLGVPFAANVDHPALYPPAWLMAAAPASLAAADLLVVMHLLALALGVALLARRAGASDAASIVAGAAAGVGGPAFLSIGTGAVFALAWCPWIWLAAHGLARARGRLPELRWSIALAMLAAVQLAAGAVVLVPATLIVAAAIAGRPRAVALVGLAAVLAGLLGAALLVPAAHVSLAPGAPPPGWPALAALVWPAPSMGYVGAPVVLLAALGARGRAGLALVAAALGLVVAGAWIDAALLAPAGVVACVLAGRGLTAIARAALARWSARTSSAILAGAGAVVVGSLLAWSWRAVPQVERAPFDRPPLLVASLEARASLPPRIARPPVQAPLASRAARTHLAAGAVPADRTPPADALARAHRTAEANSAARFGVAYARGRDRAISSALDRTWRAAAMASERFLDLYAIEAMAAPSSLRVASGLPVLGEDAPAAVVLLGNESRRPRAFVAPRWRWFAADDDARADIFPQAIGGERGFGHATVRLAGVGVDSETGAGPVPLRRCEVTAYRPERVALSCPADTDGFAVLLDSHDAGWSATVDGVARPLARADLVARAVRKHPGETRVVMRYRAPGLGVGLLISALAWLNAVIALVVSRPRRAT